MQDPKGRRATKMPILGGRSLSCIVANKNQQNLPNRPEHWRNGQGRFGGGGARRPRGTNTPVATIIIPTVVRGSQTTPSKRWVRADSPAKGTAGGRGGPCCPSPTLQRECKMQDINKAPPNTKNAPKRIDKIV